MSLLSCTRAIALRHFNFCRVLESKHKDYAAGDIVQGMFGWTTHFISDGDPAKHGLGLYKVDKSRDIRLSTALGVLGMPG